MNRPYRLTPSASRDVNEILNYVLEHSGPRGASHVHRCLNDGFLKIGAHPLMGHAREDLGDECLRIWAVLSYLVIYRPETKPVEIVRVIHGSRDFPRALQNDD